MRHALVSLAWARVILDAVEMCVWNKYVFVWFVSIGVKEVEMEGLAGLIRLDETREWMNMEKVVISGLFGSCICVGAPLWHSLRD